MNRKALLLTALAAALLCPLWAAGKEKGPWKDMYVEVGDIKIHYLEAGSGDRTLVFIPGWTLTAEIWREQIPYFAARGFRVIAVDPRSHGQTTKTDAGNTYHQQAADLHALLQTLKIEHSYLVGWASGATVVLEYISSPETLRPEKVVLVEGVPAGLRFEDCPGATALQQARTLLLGFQDDRGKTTDQFVRSLFSARQPELLYKQLAEDSLKTPVGAAASLYLDLFIGDRRPAWLAWRSLI
jgi:pimeloyl-ACP methyl ester carboxylesterase